MKTEIRKPLKTRKCKVCKTEFIPRTTLHSLCSGACAIKHMVAADTKRKAKELADSKRETKAKLEVIKPRSKWLSEAQAVVNKYVRLRDKNLGCITCDKTFDWHGQWHASHYRTTKAASAVRFNLWNIHKSCSVCNNYLSGNLSEYEHRIRAKIGDKKVDWIKSQNKTVRYSIEYLKRLKGIFKKKCARLERRYL